MILIITSFVKYNKHLDAIVFMSMLLYLHMVLRLLGRLRIMENGKWMLNTKNMINDHVKLNLHDDQCIHKGVSSCKSVGKSLIKPRTTAARSDRESKEM